MAAEAKTAIALASDIWKLAEVALEEHKSSKLMADYLAANGFKIDYPIRAMPTAFRAVAGKGSPVIGILGEYDALPGCGATTNDNGHGCGHHLLGMAAATGAVAAAKLLAQKKVAGKIVFWGCPAEETLVGKVYMARDGAFRGLDACLGWHPSSRTKSRGAGGSALDSIVLEFSGRTAHAAYADAGRSALDGAILTDVAVNYLREHIPDNVRIHSVFPHAGEVPNVVPGYAKAWYFIRGRDRQEVDAVRERLLRCARGAAMATETKVKVRRLTSLYNRLPNKPIAEQLLVNLKLLGTTPVKPQDVADAKTAGMAKPVFCDKVQEEVDWMAMRASTDEDTVSWLAPFSAFYTACWPISARSHHLEVTMCGNTPFAYRGMLLAAEVFAGMVWDLVTMPKLLAEAKAEFKRQTRGFTFDPLVPRNQKPPHGSN